MITPLLLFLLLLLCGCSSHFDLEPLKKEISIPRYYSYPSYVLSSEIRVVDCWWERFKDPRLIQLIKEAIRNNLDIRAASFKILKLKAKVMETSSLLYPELSLGFKATRYRQNYEYETPTGGEIKTSRTSSLYSITTDVSYELDLWGKLKKLKSSSEAELYMTTEEKRVLLQSIICKVVEIYLKISALRSEKSLIKKTMELEKKTLEVLNLRFDTGTVGYSALLECENRLKELERELAYNEKNTFSLLQDLWVILGRYPKTDKITPELDLLKIGVWKIPANLPADLILRRPDIQAEVAKLRSVFFLKEAKKVSFFPSLKLTGSFGYASEEFRALFSSSNLVWSIASTILQPLFTGRKLLAQYKEAKYQYQEQVLECAKTILNAFKEVERGLLNYEVITENKNIIEKEIFNLKKKEAVLNKKYKRGFEDIITLLDTKKKLLHLKQLLLQLKLELFLNHIYLYKSLGGEWDKKCF